MKILVNKEVEIEKWQELLSNSSQSSPFQTPRYFNFFNEIDSFTASVHAVEQNGNYQALCVVTLQKEKGIKSFFSRRAIVYGGPLIKDNDYSSLVALLSSIYEYYKKKAIYIEIRNYFDYSMFLNSFISKKWIYEQYLNFKLELNVNCKDDILFFFKYNRRREIKISLTEGAEYGLCEKEEDVVGIYRILKDLYNQKVKLPLPTLNYFLELYRRSLIKVFYVKHNNLIIGGSFCPFMQNKAIYTYYYCGLREYHKKIFPTHLAVLAAMEFAIDNSIPMIDFMGAGKPGIDYGVRKYKSEFGGELVDYGRFIKVLKIGRAHV